MSWKSYERYAKHHEECPYSALEREFARNLITDLIDEDGLVRSHNLRDFHNTLLGRYNFVQRRRTQQGVLPGGWHFFYIRYHLLLRVKTSGTEMRRRAHMTLSLAVGRDMRVGLEWDDELMKFSKSGDLLPKRFALEVVNNDWSLWRYRERAAIADEIWAQACHFDFPNDFDVSGAATIHLP